MIIYQIHKSGGEWEDYFDHIVGSFLRKEKAEQRMSELQEEDANKRRLAKHCEKCPCIDAWNYKDSKPLVALMNRYCEESDIHINDNKEVLCHNYTTYWTEIDFRIEEVEVEE